MRELRVISVVTIAVLMLVACGDDDKTTATSTTGALRGNATVLAASSLTNGFTELGKGFEASNPGTKIVFSFGSSSDLAQQIGEGAPADVFASADQKNMEKVVAAKNNAAEPANFAANKLAIAVEKGNPKNIATLSDLSKPGTIVMLCDASAPCGKFADEALRNANVTVTPSSREPTAKATLSKVELGEADAAIVYVSDVASSGKVDSVTIPDDVNVSTTLPIALLKSSHNLALAKAWVAYVLAHKDELVENFGFLPV